MKFIHTADIHLAKRVNGFSMLDEQKHMLDAIIDLIKSECADGLIIAGDVYDKSLPPAEAVALFDDFLFKLHDMKIPTFLTCGNHDSPERLAYGGRLFERNDIFLSPVYDGQIKPIVRMDEYGEVCIYLLPFIKPANIRPFLENETIENYTDAVKFAVGKMNIDKTKRNVLVAHQFVTGGERSDSELSIGGTDNVDVEVFDGFDYVALGHLHAPQKVKSETVRYAGSPLKYSYSEIHHKKSVTIVDIKEKGNVQVSLSKITPLRNFLDIRGTYDELTSEAYYEPLDTDAYFFVTLTDELERPMAIASLRKIYPNIMQLCYDNVRTRTHANLRNVTKIEALSPLSLFERFYEEQNGIPLSDEQSEYLTKRIAWEEKQ